MPNATATIGTIPAMTLYQPGALAITGDERAEIASSGSATAAATYQIIIVDFIGKAPSVMTTANPGANDMVAFYQHDTGLPRSTYIGNLSIPSGNLPVGGNTSQILAKVSGTNYDATWVDLSSLVTASTSLFLTGTATIALGVATGGIGSAQIATGAVGSTQLGTAAVDLSSADVTGTLPLTYGGWGTTTLTNFGVVYGLGTTTPGITAPGAANLVLAGNNITSAPSFQQVNLTLSVTGTLGVTSGGTGTAALVPFGVLYGANATTLGLTAAGGTGTLLAGRGTANAPAYTAFPVLGAVSVTSGLNFAGQTSGVVTVQAQATAGTFNFNLPITAGTPGQALVSQGGLATAMTWTGIASGVGWGLTGANATSFSPSIATTNPPYGFDAPVNLALSASVLTGVLTVNFLGNNGVGPNATSPILIGFKNTSAALGVPGWAAVTATTSISTIVGASLGAANSSTPFRLWAVLFWQNATNVLPALINCSNTAQIFSLAEHAFATTVGMTATATLPGTFYTPAGTTALNSPYRICGYVEYGNGLATAGTYSTAPTTLELFGPGIKKPGEQIQTVQSSTATATTITTTANVTTQLSVNITPTASPNLIRFEYYGAHEATNPNTSGLLTQCFRGTTAVGGEIYCGGAVTATLILSGSMVGIDAPGSLVQQTYLVKGKTDGGTGTTFFPRTSRTAFIFATELMG